VTTSEGIILIDTPMVPTDAVRWRDEIAAKGEIKYIVNTHHHADHITGNYFFPGAVISHEGVKELFGGSALRAVGSDRIDRVNDSEGMAEYICWRVSEPFPESLPLLKSYQLKPPTITFSERLHLYSGEHSFEAMHLPGHTQAHIGVYIPKEKVFFAGDNFTNQTQPSLAHSLPREWVKSLRRIEAMDIDFVVPGHGEVCGKRAVEEFRVFIQKCMAIVRKAIKCNMSKEEAVKKISFEHLYPPDRRGVAVHPGSRMQQRNVERFYEMLSKQRKN
jgi:cyclase